MNRDRTPGQDRLAELQQTFDQSFAEAPALDTAGLEALLEVTCGSGQYALRVTDISGLVADVRITPMAAPIPELLGLAGIRGSILPVYDLGALLGHSSDTKPRWMVVAGRDAPVGLAFARLDGHLRVRPEAIMPADAAPRHVREVVHLEGAAARPIVSVASVISAIGNHVRTLRDKE